jgi:glutamate-1-semialdehyde 2,1-aminomutase
MSAIRVARGYTGREKIIKMEGCYHGHGDSFLIAAGSGASTFGTPDSPGVTKGTAQDTLIAPFNNLTAVENLINENKDQIAAIILEPVVGNMGCVIPVDGYLAGLRKLCDQHGIVLIFDEVMTGFRLALGGAQELYNVTPDLTTMGKIIGGGLPVGAYGGKKEIMDKVSPSGPIYQAGTLSGNPLAMAAGLAMLNHLKNNPSIYKQLDKATTSLVEGLTKGCKDAGISYTINQVGSMYTLFFTDKEVVDFKSATTSDTDFFARYFQSMLNKGMYLAPSQYEAMFVSASITTGIVDQILDAHTQTLKEL